MFCNLNMLHFVVYNVSTKLNAETYRIAFRTYFIVFPIRTHDDARDLLQICLDGRRLGFTVPFNSVFNLFTTIHDGNFRRHSSLNVTIK